MTPKAPAVSQLAGKIATKLVGEDLLIYEDFIPARIIISAALSEREEKVAKLKAAAGGATRALNYLHMSYSLTHKRKGNVSVDEGSSAAEYDDQVQQWLESLTATLDDMD